MGSGILKTPGLLDGDHMMVIHIWSTCESSLLSLNAGGTLTRVHWLGNTLGKQEYANIPAWRAMEIQARHRARLFFPGNYLFIHTQHTGWIWLKLDTVKYCKVVAQPPTLQMPYRKVLCAKAHQKTTIRVAWIMSYHVISSVSWRTAHLVPHKPMS